MENKNNKQSLVKGAMILSIGVLVSRIIGMLYRIPIRNILGDEGNSLYSVAYTVYAVILTLTAIAIPGALSKLIAEREAAKAHKEAQRVFYIALIYSLGGAFILALAMWFGADWIALTFFPTQAQDVAMPIRALAPTVMIATTLAVMRGYFQGRGDMTPTATSQVIEQIFNVIFSIFLASIFVKMSLSAGATGSALGTGIGAFAGFVVLIALYFKERPKIKADLAESEEYTYQTTGNILKQILGMMIPVVISTSVFSIMTFIDQSMISSYLPNSIDTLKAENLLQFVPVADAASLPTASIVNQLSGQMGFQYNTFMNIPVSLVMQLGLAAVPAVAAATSIRNFKDVRKKCRLIFKVGMLIAAPSAIGLLLYAEPIFMLLNGDAKGAELLSAGAIGIVVIALAQLSAGILQGMSKQRIPTINAVIACVVKVIVNVIFLTIPRLNVFGFVHSTTICYLIYAVLNIRYLCKALEMRFNWKTVVIKPMLSAAIMGLVSYGFYLGLLFLGLSEKIAILIVIPLAAVVYFFTGLATRTITQSDLMNIPGGKKVIAFLKK